MASSSSAAIPPSPPWTELPEDLTANILQRLQHTEEILKSAQRVCTTWWRVCKNPTMWRAINLHYRRCALVDEFESIFRCAVDRSQGQLVELKLGCFEGDRLLNYFVERYHSLSLYNAYCFIYLCALIFFLHQISILNFSYQ